jgi:hypothetical protein
MVSVEIIHPAPNEAETCLPSKSLIRPDLEFRAAAGRGRRGPRSVRCRFLLISRAVYGDAVLPDGDDVPRRIDIDGGVAVDEDQIGQPPCPYDAASGQAELRGRKRGRRPEGLKGSQAGLDEQRQLAVEAGAVGRSGIRSVGAGQDGNALFLEQGHRRFGRLVGGRLHPEAEAPSKTLDVGGLEVGGKMRVLDDGRSHGLVADSLDDAQGGDDERFFPGGEPSESRVGRAVEKEMGKPIHSRVQGVPAILERRRVDDSHLVPGVSGFDEGGDRGQVERRPGERISRSVIQNDLDEIGPFGDPGVDERAGFPGPPERRDLESVLCPVTAGGRGQDPRGDEEGPSSGFSRRLVLFQGFHQVGGGEHVDDRRDAEDERLSERFSGDDVDVGVDESGEEGLPRPVDDLGPRRGLRFRSHRRDPAAFEYNVRLRD